MVTLHSPKSLIIEIQTHSIQTQVPNTPKISLSIFSTGVYTQHTKLLQKRSSNRPSIGSSHNIVLSVALHLVLQASMVYIEALHLM